MSLAFRSQVNGRRTDRLGEAEVFWPVAYHPALAIPGFGFRSSLVLAKPSTTPSGW
jgi:hypothetical protein